MIDNRNCGGVFVSILKPVVIERTVNVFDPSGDLMNIYKFFFGRIYGPQKNYYLW